MIGRLIGAITTQIIGQLLSPPYGLGLLDDDQMTEYAEDSLTA